jgi:hypothetical protein
MPSASEVIDAAIVEVTNARARVAKLRSSQVRGIDDVASLKSTAYAWFRTHRPLIADVVSGSDLAETDEQYRLILDSTAKHAAKRTYLGALQAAKLALIDVRGLALTRRSGTPTDDTPPDFAPLVGNPEMREILSRRWLECQKCVNADAHLAAIVMMGGLLEAMFVARANRLSDKRPLINATNAPKDKATGKTKDYTQWMLDSYIKVGFELRWITASAMSVAEVLKEYRNFIHPEKERRHGVILEHNDSSMFWEVTKTLVRQLLMSAQTA